MATSLEYRAFRYTAVTAPLRLRLRIFLKLSYSDSFRVFKAVRLLIPVCLELTNLTLAIGSLVSSRGRYLFLLDLLVVLSRGGLKPG